MGRDVVIGVVLDDDDTVIEQRACVPRVLRRCSDVVVTRDRSMRHGDNVDKGVCCCCHGGGTGDVEINTEKGSKGPSTEERRSGKGAQRVHGGKGTSPPSG